MQLLRGRYHLQPWPLNRACLTLAAIGAWRLPMLGTSLNQRHYQPDPNIVELAESSCILVFLDFSDRYKVFFTETSNVDRQRVSGI